MENALYVVETEHQRTPAVKSQDPCSSMQTARAVSL